MGKINIANIGAGLNKVKSITDSLDNLSHFEMVPTGFIAPASDNPYAKNDTPESLEELAQSIKTNGLIHPIAVNKISADVYQIISGERRFKAISRHLNLKNIPCMVYDNLSMDTAKLKLHAANLDVREYTTAQKLQFYQETDRLLRSMKESGKYTGPIQKGIAELLGVSNRQVRRYKTVTEDLSQEQRDKVLAGEISIDAACKSVNPPQNPANQSENSLNESGRASAFYEAGDSENSSYVQTANANLPFEQVQSVQDESTFLNSCEGVHKTENPANQPKNSLNESGRASAFPKTGDSENLSQIGKPAAFDSVYWNDKIKSALKKHYNLKEIYLYYIFDVPTPQEAIKEILKPQYGYSGSTVNFADGKRESVDARSQKITIRYVREEIELTYSQVDTFIRQMIRGGEWITKEQTKKIVLNKIQD